jgi:putative peptidoglycan lipid II flippase
VFEHGAFTRADTFAVAPVLAAFATGLPAFTLTKIFQPGFFAREDTKTPMYFAIAAVVVNVAASFILSKYFDYVGIAMATSVAAWFNATLLIATAIRRGHYTWDKRLQSRLPRMAIALIVMAAALYGLGSVLDDNYSEAAGFGKAVWGLIALLLTGAISYFAAAQLIGAFKISDLKSAMRR